MHHSPPHLDGGLRYANPPSHTANLLAARQRAAERWGEISHSPTIASAAARLWERRPHEEAELLGGLPSALYRPTHADLCIVQDRLEPAGGAKPIGTLFLCSPLAANSGYTSSSLMASAT